VVAIPPRGVLTQYFNEFRLAAYVLVLYTLGHTWGAVVNTPRFGVASDVVVASMKSVHVYAQGSDCTWYGFYRGFGVFVSIYFVFSVFAAWLLGGESGTDRRLLPIGWALFVSHAAGAIVAFVDFFPVPMAFSTAIAALLGFGCFRVSKELRKSDAR
jgi:hypothetical protein